MLLSASERIIPNAFFSAQSTKSQRLVRSLQKTKSVESDKSTVEHRKGFRMISGLYSAATALNASELNHEVISHNLANALWNKLTLMYTEGEQQGRFQLFGGS